MPKKVAYQRFRVHRNICHAVQFDAPMSKEEFDEYVRTVEQWFGYDPRGYGGHSRKGAKPNEWIWEHSQSCS